MAGTAADFTFHEATPERWADIETLFGARGACGGCWCMAWRLGAAEFQKRKGEGNRAALRALVAHGKEPGVLAYGGAGVVGWCAVAPREELKRLEASKILARVDARPVWSISCLFVHKGYRRAGLSTGLIRAAVGLAARRGATVVEAYPHDLHGRTLPPAFVWTGLLSAYLRAGFHEVARRSETRPVVRLELS